jgi:hypothetical protein
MLESLEPFVGPQAPADRQATVDMPPNLDDEPLDATKRFVSEQRGIAETLLRELVDLEQRLELQRGVPDANAAYVAAREKAENIAAALERTREEILTASTEREASATQRRRAEELTAAARSEAQSAADAVAELALLLAQARELTSQMEAMRLEREAQSRECAAAEREAALRETQAHETLAGHQAQLAAAQEEVRTLKERAEAVRREVLSEAAPRLDHVAELAGRLAELKPSHF